MYAGPFEASIVKRAKEKNLVEIGIHNLRDWGIGDYKKVDDPPFGGGAGMVIMIEPVYACLDSLKTETSKVLALTAKGETYTQSKAKNLLSEEHLNPISWAL